MSRYPTMQRGLSRSAAAVRLPSFAMAGDSFGSGKNYARNFPGFLNRAGTPVVMGATLAAAWLLYQQAYEVYKWTEWQTLQWENLQGFSLSASCGAPDLVNYSDSQIAVITVGASPCGSGSNSVVASCTGNQAFVGQLGAYVFPANTRCMVLGGIRTTPPSAGTRAQAWWAFTRPVATGTMQSPTYHSRPVAVQIPYAGAVPGVRPGAPGHVPALPAPFPWGALPGRDPSGTPEGMGGTDGRGGSGHPWDWYPPFQIDVPRVPPRAGDPPRAEAHDPRRPPRSKATRERKVYAGGRVAASIRWALNLVTEAGDVIDAAYWALPLAERRKYWRYYRTPIPHTFLTARHVARISLRQKADAVFRAHQSLDMRLFAENLVSNALVDFVYGKTGQLAGKGLRHAARSGYLAPRSGQPSLLGRP